MKEHYSIWANPNPSRVDPLADVSDEQLKAAAAEVAKKMMAGPKQLEPWAEEALRDTLWTLYL